MLFVVCCLATLKFQTDVRISLWVCHFWVTGKSLKTRTAFANLLGSYYFDVSEMQLLLILISDE